jgi:Uma2 family endonuclease
MRAEQHSDVLTAEDLERVNIPGKWTELIRGRLVVREPPGTYHGRISANLLFLMAGHVRANELGAVFSQDTGFKIAADPDTVRAPDVAFLRSEQTAQIRRRGYTFVAPDLAAEVLSPDDRPGEVLSKVGDWLDAGVKIVWVIDPDRMQARVYRANGTLTIVASDGALDGEDVLPGFSCLLSDVFE